MGGEGAGRIHCPPCAPTGAAACRPLADGQRRCTREKRSQRRAYGSKNHKAVWGGAASWVANPAWLPIMLARGLKQENTRMRQRKMQGSCSSARQPEHVQVHNKRHEKHIKRAFIFWRPLAYEQRSRGGDLGSVEFRRLHPPLQAPRVCPRGGQEGQGGHE